VLTAVEARKLYEGEESNYKPPVIFEYVVYILKWVEERAKEGHTDYFCGWDWSDESIWMVDKIKDQLENLGYIIEDDLSSVGYFKVYW